MQITQIGVMGSMTNTPTNKLITLAKQLGARIAKENALLAFGFEGDSQSLPTIAAKSAIKNNGQTLAFLWGNQSVLPKSFNSISVSTGQLRGGGREFSLVRSCHGIICLGGGSGTLTEIAIAYQANIPIVVLKNSGGWSQKLAGKFLDSRKRQIIHQANSAKQAVKLIKKLV